MIRNIKRIAVSCDLTVDEFEHNAIILNKDLEYPRPKFNASVTQHSKESPNLFIKQLGFNYHLEVICATQIIHLA